MKGTMTEDCHGPGFQNTGVRGAKSTEYITTDIFENNELAMIYVNKYFGWFYCESEPFSRFSRSSHTGDQANDSRVRSWEDASIVLSLYREIRTNLKRPAH